MTVEGLIGTFLLNDREVSKTQDGENRKLKIQSAEKHSKNAGGYVQMTLQELLGDAYKEGMTLDEINEAIANKNLVDPSTLPKSVSKEVFDKTASELAKVKKELKELQEQSMTAEEKLQAEVEKAKQLQIDYSKELSKLRAREIFIAAGLKEEDYESVLEIVVSEDEEATRINAQNMVKLIEAQRELAEATVKRELLRGTKKPPAGSGSEGITKAEFRKMSLIEKQKFAREYPEKYAEFYKEE